MRRSRARKSAVGFSLFPFLAVLICTMGALIVLLVIVVQQARVHAAVGDATGSAAELAEREARQIAWEDQTWRAEVLAQQRTEIQQQLADKRLEIAHLEEHIRQLEQRWKALQSQVGEMQRLRQDEQTDAEQLRSEIEQLRQQLTAAQQQVDEAQRRMAERRRTYTIVPYPGPHGTTRRPIYIECTARGIILQPENVVLRGQDFEGSLGPGNPLDAALRAIREYYAQHDAQGGGEPYPLLIIRPDGVNGYAVAREAMSGWEDEFGYELVSDELQLNYPPPDPALAALLQKTVADARQRQALLRRAMPASPRGSGFVVSEGRGGVVPLGGGSFGRGEGVGRGRGGVGTGGGRSEGERAASSGAADESKPPVLAEMEGAPGAGDNQLTPGANSAEGGGQAMDVQFPSMAKSRGEDWALENKSMHATGYRRPVRVLCQAHQLVLVPEAGTSQPPQAFALDQNPTQAVDQFVQSLQQRMKRWGLAPIGGYWRPQLKVAVAPDAENRYRLLEQLLEGSGLEIVRDTP